ncbi:hypothetical protein M408DRAFT_333306 [Serendipita vermifera MAFF 305830]|uniref:Uncharacterized protein n=1 Tax=Serendipita vermifera MAFF 305830 TaxID=933852 RepID=A0A0C3AR02_SERVB|nr:hypothetical protein M408DRAFT_333306 [Serendipita vermifera MAFF 305830]
MYGGGGDMGGMSDRFGSRAVTFGSSSASGMNGFGPIGGGGPGMNGFGSAGHGGHGHSHGHGHGGSSPYDYTSDARRTSRQRLSLALANSEQAEPRDGE